MSATPGNAIIGGGGASRLTTRTSLPRCRSAYAIASEDPIASPSGRACDVITNRCRRRISSATAAAVDSLVVGVIGVGRGHGVGRFASGGALGILVVEVAQDLLDAVLVPHPLANRERGPRPAREMENPADLPPEEWRGPGQRLRRFLL